MPNPLLGRGLNRSRSQDAERPKPITPVPEDYAGDNIPYRGVVPHGAPVKDNFRDPETDMPVRPDGRLVDVYEHEDREPDPIPVYIVNSSSRERRGFRVVTTYAGGTTSGMAKRILSRDDARTRATIRCPEWGSPIYISHHANNANQQFGFPLLAGQTYVTDTQDEIYAFCPASADDQLTQIAVEYRTNLDG